MAEIARHHVERHGLQVEFDMHETALRQIVADMARAWGSGLFSAR